MRPARARDSVLGLLLVVGVGTGAVAKRRDLYVAFGAAPRATISAEVRLGAAALRRRVGPDAALVHVSDDVDWNACGAWQRVLHPNPVVCLRPRDAETVRTFRVLRERRLLRWAFGAGAPPAGLDPAGPVEELPGGLWLAPLEARR